MKQKENPTSPFRVSWQLAWPNQPFWLHWPGQSAGNSERTCWIFFSFLFKSIFLNMKPLSVDMACLLNIQNKIQAVC